MAMQIPSDGDADDAEPMIDMNTTPLIDVMLVLLVMLIITIPIQLHSVNMSMPVAAVDNLPVPEKIDLTIASSGETSWQGSAVDAQALEQLMQSAAAQSDPPTVHITADRHSKYSALISVLSMSRRKGLNKIVIDGNEQYGR